MGAWFDADLLKEQFHAILGLPSLVIERFASASSSIVSSWDVDKSIDAPFNHRQLIRECYRDNIVAFACINEISQTIAEPPLVLENTAAKSGTPQVVTGHALNELLSPEGYDLTARDFIEIEQTWIESVGDGYALIDRSNGDTGLPLKLRPQLPSCFKPKRDKDGGIRKYEYTLPGAALGETISASRVARWRGDPDPENIALSLAPLQHAKKIIKLDNSGIDTLYNFFYNGGMPLGLLKTKRKVLRKEMRFIQKAWSDQYAKGNQFKVGVLGGEFEYDQIGVDPSKMRLDAIFDITESRLCAIWQIPPILIAIRLGLLHSTYSNYEQAFDDFMFKTIPPKWEKFLAVINKLAAEWGAFRYRFDLGKLKAYQEKRIDYQRLVGDHVWKGLVTFNEYRRTMNLDPIAGGDVLRAPDGSWVNPQQIFTFKPQPPDFHPAPGDKIPAVKKNGKDDSVPADQTFIVTDNREITCS